MMVRLEKDGRQLLFTAIVYLILTAIAIVLRLIAKSKTKRRFAFDDLYILSAFVVFAAWAGLVMGSVIDVGGTYQPLALSAPREQLAKIYKLLYIAELLFIWGITLAKVSILTWYGSIFSTQKIRRAKDIVLIACLLWCIATSLVTVFQCVPLKEAWDPLRTTGTQCVRFGIFIFFQELTNVLLDITILLLPISVIGNLQLPARQRLLLILIFVLGGFVCITGILKMRYSFSPKETIAVSSISLCIMWSTIELGTAIICACLPTYRPLLHGSRFGYWIASAKHSFRRTGSSNVARTSSPKGFVDVRSGYNKFNDDSHSDKIPLNEVAGGSRIVSKGGPPIPPNVISVERRIEVS